VLQKPDRFLRATLRVSLLILLGAVVASCRPCGCSQCEMDRATLAILRAGGIPATSASMHFGYSPLPGDDDFSLTTTSPGPAGAPITETVSGTYHDDGNDTYTFTSAPGSSSTILQNRVRYKVKCDGKKLTFSRGAGFVPLSFVCGGLG
jgi:hypothetical protein